MGKDLTLKEMAEFRKKWEETRKKIKGYAEVFGIDLKKIKLVGRD